MARRWNIDEEQKYRTELIQLYVQANKTIDEVGEILNISPKTVFDRLKRLGIESCREKKESIYNKRRDLALPECRSKNLSELFGVLLGDGHITHFQLCVTLGSKELEYAHHVSYLIETVFGKKPGLCTRKTGHRDVYLGSTMITGWLLEQGLVHNKVAAQVDVPLWIFRHKTFMNAFLRGFFDTDGSIYRLRYGMQISLTNKSIPLLHSLQQMLIELGYSPSGLSAFRVYLTKKQDVDRFFREVQPANSKHRQRYEIFKNCVGTEVVKRDAL
ncbi:MAG TPA: LAGLIDADG family homing endonuclease [Candidatus Paceibacterota bacterium]